MSIITRIKFKDFIKAVRKCAHQKFGKCNIISKKGTGRRIELFKKETDTVPTVIWVVHEDKFVYSKDLKKACANLRMTKEEFLEVVDRL